MPKLQDMAKKRAAFSSGQQAITPVANAAASALYFGGPGGAVMRVLSAQPAQAAGMLTI